MALAKCCDICGTYYTPEMEDECKSVIVDAGPTKTVRVWYGLVVYASENSTMELDVCETCRSNIHKEAAE